MFRNSLIALIFLTIILSSCSDISEINNITKEEQEAIFAIPLINTTFSINDLTDRDSTENVAIAIDDQDRVTVVYKGDVVRQDVDAVFPAVPFFPVPLLDTVYTVPVPFASDQRVDRAVFGDTKVIFAFNSQFEEDLDVHITVPQLSKDGKIYETDFSIDYTGTAPVKFKSDSISLKGWTLQSDNNKITINYDARLVSGERVKIETALMVFNNIAFDYVEGYFGSEVFDISGDFIPVGILETWKSGGLTFADPQVNVRVENTFGFPVRSIFKEMKIVTTTGETFDMESEIIDNNIDFTYPSLNELGVKKITEFSFNKNNSNIVELFKERVARVSYDIDAGANPDMDESITGFVNEDSYFLVSVDVALPLEGTVNNLILESKVDLDFSKIDRGNAAEFKSIITNHFPADITMQGYVFNESDQMVDSLFKERFFLPGAPINANGIAEGAQETVHFEDFDGERFATIKKGKKLLLNVKINTSQAGDDAIWIYNGYGIDFRMGAKLKTNI